MAVELIYCATPSRLKDKTEEIMDFVDYKTPHAPFHPFKAFPWEKFEGNPKVGRENAMNYCLDSIKICNRFGLFGISSGTSTIELPEAIRLNKPIEVFIEQFDIEWEKYAKELTKKHPELKDNLRRIGVLYD